MGAEHALYVTSTGDGDAVIVLLDVNDAEIFERRRLFRRQLKVLTDATVDVLSHGFIGNSKCKIVDLAKK